MLNANLLNKDKTNMISRLYVNSYRNHDSFELTIPDSSVVLHGKNGVGKTSILEAISIFAKGRGGLRNAKYAEMVKSDRTIFNVNMDLNIDNLIKLELNTSYDKEKKIKKFTVNDKEVGSSKITRNNIPMLWVAPYAEKIFLGASTARRSFIDNLTANFNNDHLKRVSEYDKLLKQRSKILKENKKDSKWLDVLEDMMSKLAVSISSSRIDLISRLEGYFKEPLDNFPKLNIKFLDCLETALLQRPAIDVETELMRNYNTSRKVDSILGGSQYGPQKSDLIITNENKNIVAKMCSSGEQKCLLISIIIACSRALRKSINCPPIILLDDVFSHLDQLRKSSLLKELANLGSQSWITITEKERFLHNNKDFCYYSL